MSEETPRPIMLYVEGGMFVGKEMVFCKDCKYWNKIGHAMYCTRHISIMYMDVNDFCSRGERK